MEGKYPEHLTMLKMFNYINAIVAAAAVIYYYYQNVLGKSLVVVGTWVVFW